MLIGPRYKIKPGKLNLICKLCSYSLNRYPTHSRNEMYPSIQCRELFPNIPSRIQLCVDPLMI